VPDADEDQPGPVEDATSAESPHARAESVSNQPTRPGLHGRTQPSGTGSAHSAHSATATRALRGESLTRAAGFARMIAVLGAAALVPCWLVSRSQTRTPIWVQATTAAALALASLTGTWVWLRVRDSRRPDRMVRIFGVICVLASVVVQLYAGVFSPAPVLITLGIGYFGLLDDRRAATAICLGAVALYCLQTILVLAGLLPDLGLFPADAAPLAIKLAAFGTVIAVFTFLFVQTRQSRAATHQAIERLDEALRQVQQREALLDEANQNLDQALAAGGRRGVYSGRSVGAYRLGELLGRGGMGEVYAAAHQQTGATVAVKLLSGQAVANRDIVERFLREAELARRLRSPNLVEILELGDSQGEPFIAMEQLKGHDLGWHLRRRKQLSLPEVIELAAQVARGLSVAHRADVVHRDLKPANLFCVDAPAAPDAKWKILDFGIAKLRGSTGTLTQRALVGTPGYMSPEQAEGGQVDARSDVFSFGSVLYRALTGRPAFSGPDTPKVLFDVVYRSPARPSSVAPSLPTDLDAVLAIALAKDRDDRFASAVELASAIEAAARGGLSPDLRARAEAVLSALPWGKARRPRDED
jgi:serine/threonine-protein kinase